MQMMHTKYTNVREKYCLYDTFHEGNAKQESEVLRRIELVKNLRGTINTQRAEQGNHAMNRYNHYLCETFDSFEELKNQFQFS